jgi:hypothetical protein
MLVAVTVVVSLDTYTCRRNSRLDVDGAKSTECPIQTSITIQLASVLDENRMYTGSNPS